VKEKPSPAKAAPAARAEGTIEEKIAWLEARTTPLDAHGLAVLDEVFEHVMRAHSGQAWRRLLRAGVPKSEAEELLQEVLATLSQRLKAGGGKGCIRKLVAKITRGKLLNHWRDRQRQPDTVALPSSGSALPESAGDVERAVDVRKLAQAFLHELPSALQDVVREAVLADRSDAEAAAALGLPLGTVKTRLRQAIARLQTLGTPSRKDAVA